MKYVTSAVNKFKLSKNLLIYCFVFLICGFSTSYLFTFDSYVYTTASIQVFLDRPIIIPLFNLLMLDNPVLIVIAQSIIFALSLYYFAKNISRLIENRYYKNLLFFMIILFSFSYSIIRWTNAIESESYCMSAGLLFMALLFSKRNHNNLLVWSLVLIFYIFTRDTNTYMLIFLLPIIYYKLRTNKKLCFQVIIIAICLVLINVFMCLKSELRSGEPMRNNYQSRVFLNDELTEHFHETYGMPIPPHQNYVGNLYQIYNILPDYQPKFNSYTRLDQGFNPPDYLQLYNFSESKIIANPEFESWFKLYGKKSFTNYLIVNGFFLKDVFTKYYNFIFFMPQLNNYNYIYNPSYTTALTKILVIIGFIFNNLESVGIFLVLCCIFCLVSYKTIYLPRTVILADIIILSGLLGNSIISFWGSGMEFTRHCFISASGINLCLLINSFLILGFSSSKHEKSLITKA